MPRLLKHFLVGLVIFTCASLLGAWVTGASAQQAPTTGEKAPQVVEVGIYLLSVYELTHGADSYMADSYLWFKWKGDIDPTKTLEFTNMVDRSTATIDQQSKEPLILPDGTKYQIMKVEGRFTDPSEFYDYPFDDHDMSIHIEDSVYGVDGLVYKIDSSSNFDRDLSIPGWRIVGMRNEVAPKLYDSQFGLSDPPIKYSNASFALVIERPSATFYWKLLLPLVVIVLAGLSALIMPPSNVDARSALVAGSLLTTVFLQKSYSDMLPNIDYLVLMDKIYVAAYLVILVALMRTLYSYVTIHVRTDGRGAVLWKVDRYLFVILVLAFFAASAVLVISR